MKRWGWISLVSSVLALWAFSDIGEDLSDPGWAALEHGLAAPLLALRSPGLNRAILSLTWLGSQVMLTVVVLLALCFLGSRREKVVLLITALGTSLTNLALKTWFARPRPGFDYSPLSEEPYFSFPSGHVMIALAVYGLFAYLWLPRLTHRWQRVVLVCSTALLVLAIAATRVYLAVHYPGDVVGGIVAGWPCLCLGIFLHRSLTKS